MSFSSLKQTVNSRLPAAVGLFALLAVGCGSSASTPAKSPSDGAVQAPTIANPAAPGQQGGMSDAPSSGEPAQERPKMSASAAAAYSAGMAAFQNGDLQGARTQFTQAAQADQKAFQAFYSLGVVKERLGDTAGALAAYRQATLIVSDYEPAIFAYAVLLARSGRADEAVEYMNGRLTAMPKSAAVSGAMAEIKSIQGDSGAAQRYAQEALKKNPDYRPAMVTIARDHYRARRLDLALYALKGILDGYGTENPPRDKNNAEARLIRGLIYKEQNLRGPAMEELKKALELRPDLVEARVHLATYLLESGNPSEAAPLLEGALRYQVDHVIAHLNLGDAYRLLGKVAESRRELEWVAQKDPALYQVHYDLGVLFLTADSVPGLTPIQAVDRAIDQLEQYKKMRPRQAGSNDDTDELITRAKTKKGILQSKEDESKAVAAQPAAATPAQPAPAAAQPAPAPAKP
ncbi:MAG TPA: tetratricopeptide repeat protein [Polyangiaceae bacterium]|nr:tetratricopeptide repeat protein [Polyangiaceae bacterium]